MNLWSAVEYIIFRMEGFLIEGKLWLNLEREIGITRLR